MKKILRKGILFLSTFFLLIPAYALPDLSTTVEQDNTFLELRNAVRKKDLSKTDALAASLSNYPIPSYVEYYLLKSHLETSSETEILQFISKYENTAIADRLRNDWLLLLAKNENWAIFDREYPLFKLKDDPQLKCYALASLALKGENVKSEAILLFDTSRKNNDGFFFLISTLKQLNQFTDDDIWFQARTAAQKGFLDATKRLFILAGASSDDISLAIEDPIKVIDKGPGTDKLHHEIFIIALGRLAKKDPLQAAENLINNETYLSTSEYKAAWAQIAFPSSLALSPDALSYWKNAKDTPLSSSAQEWRVRMALRAYDWQSVSQWIDEMPEKLKDQTSWVYWKGRALQALGDQKEARRYFVSIIDEHNFYGQLALEELGRKIKIPTMAKRVRESEIAAMEKNPGFQLALKFFSMNMRFEGTREWNWQLRGMNDRQLLAVAEFAKRKGVLDRMINTSNRTKEQMNFNQRFPTPHLEKMKMATGPLSIDLAWVYGLIRQESRFVTNARSSAGASGLMQLMPATARLVAKKIGLTNYRSSKINSFETNILLGTNYLKMMMDQLDNSEPLATAGYNAGPNRPRLWCSRLAQPIEGAIFAEIIPFNETRDYVKQVMSNATYYAALMQNRPQSLKKRLGQISPLIEE